MYSDLVAHTMMLLKKFDELCNDARIPYVLAGHSAWDAVKFGSFHGKMYETKVLIENAHLEELFSLEISESDLKFVKESKRNLSARLIDENSVLYDYRQPDWYQIPAAGIEILAAKKEEEHYVIKEHGRTIVLPGDSFSHIIRKELEGDLFPVFENYDAYFSGLVSEQWREKNWPHKILKYDIETIFSADTPYKEFFKRDVIKKSIGKEHTARRRNYWKWVNEKYKPAKKKKDSYLLYLSRTGDRFSLWEMYYPQKEELLELSASGNEDELKERLKPYMAKTDYYLKKGLGFSFDEEILQIALPILLEEKGQNYVDKLLSLIPEVYRRESVGELLIRNHVAHPLIEGRDQA